MNFPITNSEISTYMRCERMHAVLYGACVSPDLPPAPHSASARGTGLHDVLNVLYTEGYIPAVEFMKELPPPTLSSVEHMFDTYIAAIDAGIDAEYDVVSSEDTVYMTHEGIEYAGKLDLVLEHKVTRQRTIVDFKTTSKGLNQKAKELKFSRQMIHYATLSPVTPARVEYRMLRQSRTSNYNTDALNILVESSRVTATDLTAHLAFLQAVGPKIMRNRELGAELTSIIPNLDMDCTWRCPIQSVCTDIDRYRPEAFQFISNMKQYDPIARYKAK